MFATYLLLHLQNKIHRKLVRWSRVLYDSGTFDHMGLIALNDCRPLSGFQKKVSGLDLMSWRWFGLNMVWINRLEWITLNYVRWLMRHLIFITIPRVHFLHIRREMFVCVSCNTFRKSKIRNHHITFFVWHIF